MQYRLKEKDTLLPTKTAFLNAAMANSKTTAPEGSSSVPISALKSELSESLAEEQHHQNIDNAKKRAVKQMMDYEGFRQMVLGADLKPMDSKEIQKSVAGEHSWLYNINQPAIVNSVAQGGQSSNNLADADGTIKIVSEEGASNSSGAQNPSESKKPILNPNLPSSIKSSRDFKKALNMLYPKSAPGTESVKDAILAYLNSIPTKEYKNAFDLAVDTDEINRLIALADSGKKGGATVASLETSLNKGASQEEASKPKSIGEKEKENENEKEPSPPKAPLLDSFSLKLLYFLSESLQGKGFPLIKGSLSFSQKVALRKILERIEVCSQNMEMTEERKEIEEKIHKVRKGWLGK